MPTLEEFARQKILLLVVLVHLIIIKIDSHQRIFRTNTTVTSTNYHTIINYLQKHPQSYNKSLTVNIIKEGRLIQAHFSLKIGRKRWFFGWDGD